MTLNIILSPTKRHYIEQGISFHHKHFNQCFNKVYRSSLMTKIYCTGRPLTSDKAIESIAFSIVVHICMCDNELHILQIKNLFEILNCVK